MQVNKVPPQVNTSCLHLCKRLSHHGQVGHAKAYTGGEKVGAIISHNVDVAGYTSAPRRHASVPRRHPLRDIRMPFQNEI